MSLDLCVRLSVYPLTESILFSSASLRFALPNEPLSSNRTASGSLAQDELYCLQQTSVTEGARKTFGNLDLIAVQVLGLFLHIFSKWFETLVMFNRNNQHCNINWEKTHRSPLILQNPAQVSHSERVSSWRLFFRQLWNAALQLNLVMCGCRETCRHLRAAIH